MNIVDAQLLICFDIKIKTLSLDSFKAENEFKNTFIPVASVDENITTKRNNAFNSGLFKRFNETKGSYFVSVYLPLSRLFRFCQDNNRVFRGVTYQIILKRKKISNVIIKSGHQNFKVDVMHLSWILPILHPSLPILHPSLLIATQLGARLTEKAEQLKAGLGNGGSLEVR